MVARILRLVSNKMRRWVRTREARDPEAMYEYAISAHAARYESLKKAAAHVLYMRDRIKNELDAKHATLAGTCEQLEQAIDEDDDASAKLLLKFRYDIEGDIERLKGELLTLSNEAREATQSLRVFMIEMEKLKSEKVVMLFRLQKEEARKAIASITYEPVDSLEEVRSSIQEMLAEAGLEREMNSDAHKLNALKQRKLESKIAVEIERMKQDRRNIIPVFSQKVSK